MGKKRRGPTLEELLARPWCYYCERDFDDLKILISHQKAKHFKCERCGRRLNTAGGLSVHMSQVHKEQLSAVDNALPNRSSLDVEIFGMEGVPEDIIQGHHQRVATQFQQAEAERQAVTGNPPAGTGTGEPSTKKPKVESVSEMKKRLAEHRAKRAEANNGSSAEGTPAGGTPVGGTPAAGFGQGQSPHSPVIPNPQISYPQPYGANAPYQQTASPVYPTFSPGGQPQFPPHTPGQPFYGSTPSPFPPQPQQQQQQQQPQPQQLSQTNSPQAQVPGYSRSGSLPAAPSLPQRPSFGAPQVNSFQLQQMHMGHVPPPGAEAQPVQPTPADATPITPATPAEATATAAAAAAAAAAGTAPEAAEKTKKDKSKNTRLVYSDNEVSPEEKLASLPRYAFTPNRLGETTAEAIPTAGSVSGTTRDSDNTNLDPTD